MVSRTFGVPNWVKICSYKNFATSCFIKDFKACISANFVRYYVATTLNPCPFLITGKSPIKSTPHFSKGSKGGMGCKGPLTIDFVHKLHIHHNFSTIIMGILEKGGLVLTYQQNLLCYDLSHIMASIKPIMKFIQKT
jgi:hypothetical protein